MLCIFLVLVCQVIWDCVLYIVEVRLCRVKVPLFYFTEGYFLPSAGIALVGLELQFLFLGLPPWSLFR